MKNCKSEYVLIFNIICPRSLKDTFIELNVMYKTSDKINLYLMTHGYLDRVSEYLIPTDIVWQ